MHKAGIIVRYMKYLPVTDKTPVVTLNEGSTPLIYARYISEMTGLEVYLKYEGLNPTGSFKDRGMTMAISKACEEGAKAVMCASTGNTSASAAAYAARSGLKCIVIIPEGAIALGKLSQALMHGAIVIAIKGNFDDALKIVRAMTQQYPITSVNSINPYRIEGQKTAAFEICDALEGAPDYLAIPVGNAGNITAYWKGFKEYHSAGLVSRLPKMLGFQAAGAAPIVEGRPIPDPKTIATAIKIGNPASWQRAVEARDESGGVIDKVSDDEILDAYRLLAGREGVFCEPASAASVAGLLKLWKQSYFPAHAKVVAVLTGHGLKDPDRAIATGGKPQIVENSVKLVKEILQREGII
ncbi:MAG TPA: threonine synthase [Firmicutes bacterium]|nr:threonine synthase [Bacillota bacterium]